MRIATSTVYDLGVSSILRQQQNLLQVQQQVASGRRILTPSDDPVAAARVVEISQAQALNAQYGTNRGSAKDSLGLVDNVLSSVTNVIQDVKVIAVNAGNPILTDSQRTSLAVELEGKLQELLGLANSTDGTGQYLFSGYQGATQPFTQTASGVQYNGDQGLRLMQVSPSRRIAVTEPGSTVFERIKNGNGVFVAGADSGNAGTGIIGPGSVVNPSALTGHDYQIVFSVAGGVTTYSVVDTTTSTTLSSGNPFVSGAAISFDGMQIDITGAPANGDKFTVTPSSNQSLFKTLEDLITLLRTPVTGAAASAQLTNGLNSALANLDQALNNVLAVRASVGSSLKEIDSLQSAGEDLGIQYQQTLSKLQDVDYAKAISDLSQQQFYLEAAQKSFLKVTGLSLFNYV